MQLPRGSPSTARIHRDWLRHLPTVTGKPLTRIAHEIKIAASTLTRPLKEGDDGTSTLHANTIAKIVAHTGVSPPVDVAGTPPAGRRILSSGEEASPYQPDSSNPIGAAVLALVAGRNHISALCLQTRAVELAGFLPGDVVLVDHNGTPETGDLVVAEVYDWQRARADQVVRVFEIAGPVTLLTAKSLDPNLQQPLVVDNERITIKGVVLPHRLRAPAS